MAGFNPIGRGRFCPIANTTISRVLLVSRQSLYKKTKPRLRIVKPPRRGRWCAS